ncbi:hypothetical protein OPAG_06923 [Rhodococcus opacus PD630]|uniref:hypothetical protein n=1 Tax=Rhodococcus opacus TaxID=37919 RepID=UPI00029CBE43|nr:hypothetical protein [Rhodococcus opacus]EHI43635.1 hypothetical protein OPAG_06923 [Rhodococcus opacus PD630]UDH01239.1 twin-arginine translocation pathway signal [Rhodococcus opacus PD630]
MSISEEERASELESAESPRPTALRSDRVFRRLSRSLSGRRVSISAVVVAVALSALTGYLYFGVHSGDQRTGDEAAAAVRQAVTDGTTALLTYKSDTVDADLQAANGFLTGEFGSYYQSFTRDVVAPAAKEQHITTTATVVGAATMTLEEDHAVALVMVNQATSTAINPQPNSTSTSIRVEVERQDGGWLISKFDPV